MCSPDLYKNYDKDGNLVSVICQKCIEVKTLDELFVDNEGVKWDFCKECELR